MDLFREDKKASTTVDRAKAIFQACLAWKRTHILLSFVLGPNYRTQLKQPLFKVWSYCAGNLLEIGCVMEETEFEKNSQVHKIVDRWLS
jgi:hypothetical protein